MKKLSLNASVFQKGEVLTRGQLKKVMGGNGSGGTCIMTGWTAHSANWLSYTTNIPSREEASEWATSQGWPNYCHDTCLTSCCAAQPFFTGCS